MTTTGRTVASALATGGGGVVVAAAAATGVGGGTAGTAAGPGDGDGGVAAGPAGGGDAVRGTNNDSGALVAINAEAFPWLSSDATLGGVLKREKVYQWSWIFFIVLVCAPDPDFAGSVSLNNQGHLVFDNKTEFLLMLQRKHQNNRSAVWGVITESLVNSGWDKKKISSDKFVFTHVCGFGQGQTVDTFVASHERLKPEVRALRKEQKRAKMAKRAAKRGSPGASIGSSAGAGAVIRGSGDEQPIATNKRPRADSCAGAALSAVTGATTVTVIVQPQTDATAAAAAANTIGEAILRAVQQPGTAHVVTPPASSDGSSPVPPGAADTNGAYWTDVHLTADADEELGFDGMSQPSLQPRMSSEERSELDDLFSKDESSLRMGLAEEDILKDIGYW